MTPTNTRWHNIRHRLGESVWGWRCVYCSTALECPTCHPGTSIPATIDHVVRRRDGGRHQFRNLVLACESCQQLKDNPPGTASNPPRARYTQPSS